MLQRCRWVIADVRDAAGDVGERVGARLRRGVCVCGGGGSGRRSRRRSGGRSKLSSRRSAPLSSSPIRSSHPRIF
eukprot:245170-Rhodomonas_salina.1